MMADFNFDEWRAQLAAGRFDGHLSSMHTAIGVRAAAGRRRWVIRWQDRTWTEDDLLLETAAEAERQSGLSWGGMNLLMQVNPGGHAQSVTAILTAIGVCELGWESGMAEDTVRKLKARDAAEIVGWEDVDAAPKDLPTPPVT